MTPLETLLARLPGAKKAGNGWSARCPAHDDRRASLSIRQSDDGTVLLRCHAGCGADAVCAAIGISLRDLFPHFSNRPTANRKRIVATYDYRDEKGEVLFQAVRFDPKDFRQRRPNGNGGWTWNLHDTRRVLYRLPELIAADPEQWVFLPEGEKDVENVRRLGLVGTTNAGGAGKWRDEYSEFLRGRKVCILPDNDDPGREHARQVAASLRGIARDVCIVELPGLSHKGDVSDWLANGGTAEKLTGVVNTTAARTIATAATDSDATSWPAPPDPIAFHGLAGDIVRAIEPHSEADPIALLVQILAGFGNVIGRTAHFRAEADRHFCNLFAVLVGQTSKARKGTSFGHVRRLLESAEKEWAEARILTGLSSGEGLIWNCRDPITKHEPIKQKGKVTGYQDIEVDAGEPDKRLLAYEAEFASTLKRIEREGNCLSAVIRMAWESGNLRTLTKHSPAIATGAHVSIIGHITGDELRRYLTTTEMANGFGNRFLWLCVRRSKCLPEGGRFHEVDAAPLVQRLVDAIACGRETDELRRDDDAAAVWQRVYPDLSEGKPGMLGAILARAEAQVMRLAMIYALLDLSDVIRREHLLAALALWDYCEASARYIFGDALGDAVADDILKALRATPDGLTRTDISNLFGRHASAERIARALQLLQTHGLARPAPVKTEGRSAELWFAVTGAAKEAKEAKKAPTD